MYLLNDRDASASWCPKSNTQLTGLVTDDSWLLFQLLQLDPLPWLEQPVSEWERDAGYAAFRDFVCGLNVMNGVAERV